MSHTIHDRKSLLNRVRRIKGQIESLERMLEGEAECFSTMQQTAAVRGAANSLMAKVIEGFLEAHLVQKDSVEDRREEAKHLLALLKTYF